MTEELLNPFIIHLKEQLTCPVCHGLLHKPKTLPCLHNICEECLVRLERMSRGPSETPLKCPVCNLVVDTSEGFRVERLPCPFYISRLKEFVGITNNRLEVLCGSCELRSTAVAFCFDCKCLVCGACVGVHKQMKTMKDHCISDLSTFDASQLPELIQGPVFCQQDGHDGEMLKFFCQDCLTCICEKCLDCSHKPHTEKVARLQHSSDASKLRIHSALSILQEKTQTCRDEIRKVDQSYRTVERRVIDARQDVHDKIEEMILLLKNHEEDILSKLESVFKDQQFAILKHRKELEQTLEQMKRAHEDVNSALERNLAVEILELEEPAAKHLLRLLNAAKPDSTPAKSMNVDYVPDEEVSRVLNRSELGRMRVSYTDPTCSVAEGEHLNETITGTGERIQFTIITKDSEGKMTYSENDCVEVNIHLDDGKVIPTRIEDRMNDGKYLVSYTPFKVGVYKIDVRVRGAHIMGSPFTIYTAAKAEFLRTSSPSLGVTSRCSEYKTVMPFGDPSLVKPDKPVQFNRPCGIAVSSRGDIAVADSCNHRVQLFTAKGELLTQFGNRAMPGQVELTNPVGVAFDMKGNIVVSDSDTRQILVLSRDGHIIRAFGSDSLECPWGVCTTRDGKITVCDWGGGSIKEFSSKGKLLKEFRIPEQHGFSSPARPYYICHHKDNYLVSLDTHCVSVLDKEGNLLYSIGGKKRHRESTLLKEPRGLTVDSNENLIVCDSGNHRIQMFTTDGKAVSFGTYGKDLGQFDKPQDVVATRYGRLYVTDHRNNRVQVLQ